MGAPSRSVWVQLPEIGSTEVHCFLAGDILGVEFEIGPMVLPAAAEAALAIDTRDVMRQLHAARDMDDLGQRFVSAVARATGFAQKGALTMEKRLRGLLAYSEVGQIVRIPGPVSLERVIEEAKKDVCLELNAAQGEISIQDSLPTVYSDMSGLQTLFDNLLSNAIKFRSTAPLRIRIWAEPVGDQWQIVMADNGIGISPAYHQLVFGLFQRLFITDDAGGVGLGLALCQRIVQQHGGKIWLNSELGKGTTVTFTLPRPPEEVNAMTLSERKMLAPSLLRESTHKAHERLETIALMAPLSSGRVSAEQYRRALAGLYGFYRPAEEALFSLESNIATAMGITPKLPALLKDLTALGMTENDLASLPLCASLPKAESTAAQIGMLYVLEGATLGGQVVRKRIAHSLGNLTPLVTNFHGFHGDKAGPWWKHFQEELSQRLDDQPTALEQAVDSALASFAALEGWLGLL